ncbi:MAG: sulfatase family protein, partial [Solirubrobacterales bacterium]
PNIILISTDDQVLTFNRKNMPATWRLLAERGTSFTNSIVSTPSCCPSRATAITGQYPHNHGVTSTALGYFAFDNEESTLPVWLRDAGYRTSHIGKYLNRYHQARPTPTGVPPGWDEWHSMIPPKSYFGYELGVNGDSERFGFDDDDYLTRTLNKRAIEFVRDSAAGDRPFFLHLDQFAPHQVKNENRDGPCKGAAAPDPRDIGRIDEITFDPAPGFNERDVSDKPSFIQALPQLDAETKESISKRYRCGVASLRAVDRGIARLVQELRRLDLLDDTAIVFTSDNGLFHGEHRVAGSKILPYEEAIRVPLVIRLPDGAAGTAPDRIHRPVANVDLAPTILDLAGAQPCTAGGNCRTMDGRSLVGLVSGDAPEWPRQRSLLLEFGLGFDETNSSVCDYAGVWSPQRVYVEYDRVAGSEPGEEPGKVRCIEVDERELYDLERDPGQLDNQLALGSGGAGDLETRLAALRDCAGIEGRDEPADESRPYCE